MIVSVMLVFLNEANYLPKLINDLKNQTYPHAKIELVFVDGGSTDHSLQIVEAFQNSNYDFLDIKLYSNPKKTLASGMNIAILNSCGDCFLKVDCHSHIPSSFVAENVALLLKGEKVCGGPRGAIIESKHNFAQTLLLVEENMFGSGFANYRQQVDVKYVKSVFQGMYHRDVIQKVGLLNEYVGRVEDNEFHYRIHQAGFKIAYSNQINSSQYTRVTFSKMLQQKYSNGYWIGKVSHIMPKCFSLFHYIPSVFVMSLIISILMVMITPILLMLLLGSYSILLLLILLITLIKKPFKFTHLLMPFLIFGIHLAYGLGTLKGLITGFKWKKWYLKNCKIQQLP